MARLLARRTGLHVARGNGSTGDQQKWEERKRMLDVRICEANWEFAVTIYPMELDSTQYSLHQLQSLQLLAELC
jgi:hypothetical protein